MTILYGTNTGLMSGGALGDVHYTDVQKRDRGLDLLLMPNVLTKGLTTPPGSPSDGQCWFIMQGTTPTGSWSGQAGKLVRYTSVTPGYEFFTPKAGWTFFVQNEGIHYVWNGTALVTLASILATGIVAGSDKFVQFNDSGVLGAVTDFQFNKTTKVLSLPTASSRLMVGQADDGVSAVGVTGNAKVTGNLLATGNLKLATAANTILMQAVSGNVGTNRLSIEGTGTAVGAEVQLLPSDNTVFASGIASGLMLFGKTGTDYERFTLSAYGNTFIVDSTYNGAGASREIIFKSGGSVSNSITGRNSIHIYGDASLDLTGSGQFSAQGKTWYATGVRVADPENIGNSRLILDTRTGTPASNTADYNYVDFRRGGSSKWQLGLNLDGSNSDKFNLYLNGVGQAITIDSSRNTTLGANLTVSGNITNVVKVVNVLDYGADNTGTTDCATALTNAVAAISSTGGRVYFPKGTYKLSSLSISSISGITLEGEEKYATKILCADAISNVFDLSLVQLFTIKNFEFYNSVQRTAGANINLNGCIQGVFENIRIQSPFYGFYTYNSSTMLNFKNIWFTSQNNSWNMQAPMYFVNSSQILLENISVGLGTASLNNGGIVIDSGIDTFLASKITGGPNPNAQTSGGPLIRVRHTLSPSSFAPRWLRFTDCNVEGGNGEAWRLENFLDCEMTTCYGVSSSQGIGVYAGSNLKVLGGIFGNNAQHGIRVQGATTDVLIEGATISGNSKSVTNTYSGVSIDSTVTNIRVVNNTINNTVFSSTQHAYGIAITAGCTNPSVFGNTIANYGTSAIFDGTGTAQNLSVGALSLTTALTSAMDIVLMPGAAESARFTVNGLKTFGFRAAYVEKTAAYTVAGTDHYIVSDNSSSNFTTTLPLSATVGAGTTFWIRKKNSTGTMTIGRSGSDTINGAASDHTATGTHTDWHICVADGVSDWSIGSLA